PATSHLSQQPLVGRMLVAAAIFIGIIGVLEGFIVFQLLTNDDYFLMLPDFLQTVLAALPTGMQMLILSVPGMLMIELSRTFMKHSRRHFVHVYEASESHVFASPILYLRPFAADESPAKLVRSVAPYNGKD